MIITEKVELTKDEWKKLKEWVPPYHVLYLPDIQNEIGEEGRNFLKTSAAQEIKEDPQDLINKLELRYFSGQSGMRILPTTLKLNTQIIKTYEYLGTGELKLNLNTQDKWINLGTYKTGIFIDPNKLINFWISIKKHNFKVRMRIFIQNPGTDGNPEEQRLIDLTDFKEEEYFSN